MTYLFILLLNIFLLALYHPIALRLDIIDKPNERSSHDYVTIRGAGVIFLATGLFWAFSNANHHLYLFMGLLAIGLISFLDDIFSLTNILRFLVQTFAVIIALMDIGLQHSDYFIWAVLLILYLGWINAFNFMDGINGITSFYSLSILIPLFMAMHNYSLPHSSLIIYLAISVLVFMFVNLRTRALAFCGDVGAVVLAYLLAYLVITLVFTTRRVEFILFGSIYGIDSIVTIIRRLINRENIFLPHRTHLYQLLSNELNWHFLSVSLLYALVQLIVNIFVLISIQTIPEYSIYFALIIIVLLTSIYLYSLKVVLKKALIQ